MTPDDVIDVLSAVAAVDRRTVGEADVLMWQQILGNLPKDLALRAIVDHFREQPGVWLEPGHIVAGVRAIQRDRYERQSLAELDARQAEQDAQLAPRIRELAESKSIDTAPPATSARPTVNPLRVSCPYCRASAGRPCLSASTRQPMRFGNRYHPSRVDLAAKQVGAAERVCGRRTAAGGRCRNEVTEPGAACRFHRREQVRR